MANAFDTDTSADALKTYLSNHTVKTFDDAREMFRIGGATQDAGDGALSTCLINLVEFVQSGLVAIPETKPGRKKEDAPVSPVETLMNDFLDGGTSRVQPGTGSYKNMLTSWNRVARYAKGPNGWDQVETIKTALETRKTRVSGGEKIARRPADVVYSVAGTALHKDRKDNTSPLSADEIALCIKPDTAERKAFDEMIAATLKRWREDKNKEAPKDSDEWNAVIEALQAYVDGVEAAKKAEHTVANFATDTVASLKTAGVNVKMNKASLTIDTSAMSDEQRKAIAKVLGVEA